MCTRSIVTLYFLITMLSLQAAGTILFGVFFLDFCIFFLDLTREGIAPVPLSATFEHHENDVLGAMIRSAQLDIHFDQGVFTFTEIFGSAQISFTPKIGFARVSIPSPLAPYEKPLFLSALGDTSRYFVYSQNNVTISVPHAVTHLEVLAEGHTLFRRVPFHPSSSSLKT